MKTIKKQSTFFFLLGTLVMSSPAMVSCHREPTELTSQEKETAKNEIAEIGNKILKDAERLDVEAALKPYLQTSDFTVVNPNGTASNFDIMKRKNIEGFKKVAAFKPTTIKEEFRFLTKNQVLYTWFGKYEMVMKTGEKFMTKSQISSMLFSKINNEWKIIYDHTSATQPVKE